MSRLALYLLGPPRVERGPLGGEVESLKITGRKTVALLAYLAVEDQSQSRETLSTLLWPESDASHARAELRRALSILRRTLEEGWLEADRERVRLSPEAEIWLDVDAFRGRLRECETHGHGVEEVCADCMPPLEEAVELYRDDFMAGFTLRDSLAYDDWQFFQTEEIRGELASALERLVRGHSGMGAHEVALPYARRRLALDPLHEPAHCALMELYAQTGQQAAALRQYRICEQTLAKELGLSPSPETLALYERIQTLRVSETLRDSGASPPSHNLPTQPTPFVGRERELADLERLIADPNARLVTITGPGGIGKTRLALAAAQQLVAGPDFRFTHGVFFVPLTALSSAEHIPTTLAEVLKFQLQEGGGRAPETQILNYLRGRRIMLLMDNMEHLLERVELLVDILETAPNVKLLVTSRERLNLQQEQIYPLLGLPFPTQATSVAEATEYAAVNLFVQTARRIRPDFEPTADVLPDLMRVLDLVEGMPLSIELAASWVGMLSLGDIAGEIQGGLDILKTEWRDVPERHRSMRAVIDASWEQLRSEVQSVLRQLSVFRGGFTRDAAREVAGASLRSLTQLASKSWLFFDSDRERYQIHELLRQYGAEKLTQDPEEEEQGKNHHSAYYCAALERWDVDLKTMRQQAAMAAIEADIQNIRTAWDWAVAHRQVVRLSQALDGLCLVYARPFRPWEGRLACQAVLDALNRAGSITVAAGIRANAIRVCARALAWQAYFDSQAGFPDDPRLRQALELLDDPAVTDQDTSAEHALVLKMMGFYERSTMRETAALEAALALLEQGLSLWRTLGDQWQQAHTLMLLACVHTDLGRTERARKAYTESLALFRTLGDRWMEAGTLRLLGRFAQQTKNLEQARRLLRESLRLSEQQNDLAGAMGTLVYLTELALHQGDFQSATAFAQRDIGLCRETGNQYYLSIALGMLGFVFLFSGEFDRAHTPLDEALAIAKDLTTPRLIIWVVLRELWVMLCAGSYAEARVSANTTLAQARELGEQFWIGFTLQLLGLLELAQDKPEAARTYLLESVAAFRDCADQVHMPISQAALGLLEYAAGRRQQARNLLFEALDRTVETPRPESLLNVLPMISVLLVRAKETALQERGIELYALACSQPFVANSPFFDDVFGTYMANAASDLPAEVVASAKARGRKLEPRKAVEKLLEELRELGWGV